jgi:hypothetical protein
MGGQSTEFVKKQLTSKRSCRRSSSASDDTKYTFPGKGFAFGLWVTQ